MKKAICAIAVIALMGTVCAVIHAEKHVKETTVSGTESTKVRCSACDGTGFTANAKGEKGKGAFACPRCKGTGKI